MEEIDLRTRLESLATHAAPALRSADDLTAIVAERHRTGRRRQFALAAVVAVVAAPLNGPRAAVPQTIRT